MRNIFDKIQGNYGIVSPSFLRSEIPLTSNGLQKIDFSILAPSSSDRLSEKKLDRNDDFLITEIGIFLMKEDSTAKYIQKRVPYVDPVIFADNSTTFYGKHLYAIYQGRLRLLINNTLKIDGISCWEFLKEPEKQQSAGAFYAINASGAEATTSVLAAASKKLVSDNNSSNPRDGFYPCTPQYLIHGDDTLELYSTVINNGALTFVHTASNQVNFVVFEARGFLCQQPKAVRVRK